MRECAWIRHAFVQRVDGHPRARFQHLGGIDSEKHRVPVGCGAELEVGSGVGIARGGLLLQRKLIEPRESEAARATPPSHEGRHAGRHTLQS